MTAPRKGIIVVIDGLTSGEIGQKWRTTPVNHAERLEMLMEVLDCG